MFPSSSCQDRPITRTLSVGAQPFDIQPDLLNLGWRWSVGQSGTGTQKRVSRWLLTAGPDLMRTLLFLVVRIARALAVIDRVLLKLFQHHFDSLLKLRIVPLAYRASDPSRPPKSGETPWFSISHSPSRL